MRYLPFFLGLSRETQRKTLEALIFASDEPLTNKTLYKILVLEEGLNLPADEMSSSPDSTGQASAAQEQSSSQSEQAIAPEAETQADTDQTPVQITTDGSEELVAPKKHLPDPKMLATLAEELVQEINDELVATERPYRVVRIAGGYQFATIAEYGDYVARLMKSRTKRRLSQAALEVLAIIAYKQPISKPEIEAIRGINSNEVINALVEKNLVTITGRSEAIGKPLLYGTTDDFLRTFGLHSLSDLPKLRELDDLFQNKAKELAGEMDISVTATSEEIIEKVQSMVENEEKIEEAHRLEAARQVEEQTIEEEQAPVEEQAMAAVSEGQQEENPEIPEHQSEDEFEDDENFRDNNGEHVQRLADANVED